MKMKSRLGSKNMKNIYIILIILIVALILIPFILQLLDYGDIIRKENFSDFVGFTDYTTIDRIDLSNNEYAYCIGGEVTCTSNTGNPVASTNQDYANGITYENNCSDGSKTKCINNIFEDVSYNLLSSYTLPKGSAFPLSLDYTGFTTGYNYVPAMIDPTTNNIKFYSDSAGTLLEEANKCNFVDLLLQDDCNNSLKTDTAEDTTEDGTEDTTEEDTSSDSVCNDKIPCIANFGTNIGDKLCCGQTGVLQNTKYVCPSTRPKCTGFKCGYQFGNCI